VSRVGAARLAVVACAATVAVTAWAGALALVGAGAPTTVLPAELLARTPFATFLVPGLLLGLVVGGSSAAAALLAWRRSRYAVDATALAGGALAVWIAVESAIVPASWLQLVYGALALALLGLALWKARLHREPRHRWLLGVTTAEALGFLAPMLAGLFATRAEWSAPARAVAVIAAGALEGLVLGAAQAWAMPVPVRRLRYAGWTALGAAVPWAIAMTLVAAAGALPTATAVALAIVALASIGGAQWLELRRYTRHAWTWIAWTALAWTIALPASFAPGPFVDETTPLVAHVVLWGCGGLVMAFAMAVVTWQGVRRLRP
jgi:hypothetical protein